MLVDILIVQIYTIVPVMGSMVGILLTCKGGLGVASLGSLPCSESSRRT
jgi:hypothetical protein